MNVITVTAPAIEPVTLTEAKTHLRVDDADHDTMITSLIVAAREYVELTTGRALIEQTLASNFAGLAPYAWMELARGNVTAIDHVKYYDDDNQQQTLDSGSYTLDEVWQPNRVWLAYGASWPSTYRRPDAVEVQFTAGYGDTAAAVPELIRSAIKLHVEQIYDGTDHSATLAALLSPFRIPMFS